MVKKFFVLISFIGIISCTRKPKAPAEVIRNREKYEGKTITLTGKLGDRELPLVSSLKIRKLIDVKQGDFIYLILGKDFYTHIFKDSVDILSGNDIKAFEYKIPVVKIETPYEIESILPLSLLNDNPKQFLGRTILTKGYVAKILNLNPGRNLLMVHNFDDTVYVLVDENRIGKDLDVGEGCYVVGTIVGIQRNEELGLIIRANIVSNSIFDIDSIPVNFKDGEAHIFEGVIEKYCESEKYSYYSFSHPTNREKAILALSPRNISIEDDKGSQFFVGKLEFMYLDKIVGELYQKFPMAAVHGLTEEVSSDCKIRARVESDLLGSLFFKKIVKNSILSLYMGEDRIGYLRKNSEVIDQVIYDVLYKKEYKMIMGENTVLSIRSHGLGVKVCVEKMDIFDELCKDSITLDIKAYLPLKTF